MTAQGKRPDRTKAGSKKNNHPSESSGSDDIKIVELGLVEDESELLGEISVLLEETKEEATSLANEAGVKPAKEPPRKQGPTGKPKAVKAGTTPKPPLKTGPGKKRQPVAAKAGVPKKQPAAERKSAASLPGNTSSVSEKTESLQRQKLEQARMRSAEAARKARQKKVGKGVLTFVFIAGLLVSIGAAAGFYLFKPDPGIESQKPVKFAVKNAPGIKFKIPPREPSKLITLNKEGPASGKPENGEKDADSVEAKTQAAGEQASAGPPLPERPEETVSQFLASWAAAWEASAGENGRIDAYISHFSTDFQHGDMDLTAWKADKAAKNRRKEWIRVGIDKVQVAEAAPDGTVEVRFLQTYASSNYTDKTEKTLILAQEGGKWKILGVGAAPGQ